MSFFISIVLFTSTLFLIFIIEKMKFNNFCFSKSSKSSEMKISLFEKGTFKYLFIYMKKILLTETNSI